MCFVVVFPFLRLNNLVDIAKKTFDSPEESTPARRMLVHGVLSSLFEEFGFFPVNGKRMEAFPYYTKLCKTHMQIAMSQVDLCLPASYENILALTLAASYAVELCKPSLCWTMNSAAAALCQHLGYHRISTMKNDSEEERSAKIHVFWFVYNMDKQLSLRLGRSSIIQDWDMSLPFPSVCDRDNPIGGFPKGIEMHLYWIKVAQIQGQTYEKLFSPAAFLKPAEERARSAAELVAALNDAWAERGQSSVLDFLFLDAPLREQIPNKTFIPPNETAPPSKRPRAPLIYPTISQISLGADPRPKKFIEGVSPLSLLFVGVVADISRIFGQCRRSILPCRCACTLFHRNVDTASCKPRQRHIHRGMPRVSASSATRSPASQREI